MWGSTDPQDQYWSAYLYCANNPINLIDPLGLYAAAATYIMEEVLVQGASQAAIAATIASVAINIGSMAASAAQANNFTPSPPYALWSTVNEWSVNQFVKTDNPAYTVPGVASQVMMDFVPQSMDDWGYLSSGSMKMKGTPPSSGIAPRNGYKPPPKEINGIQGLQRVKPKTPVQGGGGLRKRWVDTKGNIFEWDSQHGALEKYSKSGKHLGQFDPNTGIQTKPPDPTRFIEP